MSYILDNFFGRSHEGHNCDDDVVKVGVVVYDQVFGSKTIPKTKKIYSFRMVESKTITKQLIEFNKILDDLVIIEVKIEDEDNSVL